MLIAIRRVHHVTVLPSHNAYHVNRTDFRWQENASTAAQMAIMAIKRGKSVFLAQLDVPPVVPINV